MAFQMTKRYSVQKGTKIYEKGKQINELGILIKGAVSSIGIYQKTLCGSGTVIGLSDTGSSNYLFDYIAEEDCEIFAYTVDESHDSEQVIIENKKFSGLMISTVMRQAAAMISIYDDLTEQASALFESLTENKKDYLKHCKTFSVIPGDIEDIYIQPVPEPDEYVTIEIMDYCKNLNEIPLDALKAFFIHNSAVTYHNIFAGAKLIKNLNDIILNLLKYIHTYKNLLIGNDKKDLFYNYSILALETGRLGLDISVILRGIEKISESAKEISSINSEVIEKAVKTHNERIEILYKAPESDSDEDNFKLHLTYTKEEIEKAKEDMKNSLDHILDFSEIDSEIKETFKNLVTAYKNLKDKDSSDDNAVNIRRQITKSFYGIYEQVFFKYVDSNINDTIIEMFLNFGFADERLVDETQAIDLYYINKSTGDSNIFMLKDWLESIYRGVREPSKNDFDIDYQENLREIKKSRIVSPEEERAYLSDQKGKVIYEINNMIKSANKITFGKVSTFCPILSKHNLCEDMRKAYVSPERINSVIESVTKIDYSLFYREYVYKSNYIENGAERIMKEVHPYFILMPNFGSRCIMWQDIESRKRDTPARFIISVFSLENLDELIASTFARFRWDLCKNIQGIRWSDITSKSLTSEYYDYLQFYKKNKELSEKSKEKIKLILQKKGNNFKEVFAYDYIQWIKYESAGAARLNSYVRRIMLTYCPFPLETREAISENPLYSQIVKKFENDRNAKLKRFENVRSNIIKKGGTPDEDFENNIEFYKK